MAKSHKDEIENLRQMLEQNSETLQRMEVFLSELNDRLEATGEALSGKRGRGRPSFLNEVSRAHSGPGSVADGAASHGHSNHSHPSSRRQNQNT